MNAKQIKITLAVVVTIGAIAYLVVSGFQNSMVFYLTVKELRARGSDVYGEDVRVSGHVEEGTIESDPMSMEHRFVITADGERLSVFYKGVAPDTFKDGAEVVVEGKYDPSGLFVAENLLAKCPSKYEVAEPEREETAGS